MNKFLIKRAFKSIFKNKLFTILMTLLVLITSVAYTTFESSSSSFKNSYNEVVSKGALHDLVIKENFQLQKNEAVETNYIQDKNDNTKFVSLDASSLKQNSTIISGNTYSIYVASDVAYPQYGLANRVVVPVEFTINDANSNVDWANATADIKSSAKTQIEAKLKDLASKTFINEIKDMYKNELMINEMNSVSVESGEKAFKVVKYNANTEVNKAIIYGGTSQFIPSLTDNEMLSALDSLIPANEKSQYGQPNTTKGFRISTQKSGIGTVKTVSDASAYEAIVSPTYANENNKTPISLEEFVLLTQQSFDFVEEKSDGSKNQVIGGNFFEALQNKAPAIFDIYSNNIILVDKMPFIITGVGMTPDFSYPIIDEKHPTIDVKNQAIVYVNKRGFERTIDSFRSNLRENYISVKYKNDVSDKRRAEILNELNAICQDGKLPNGKAVPKNSFTKDIQMVTKFDDPNDQMTLTQERISFLSSLQDTISTISYLTTTMLVLFVSIIVAMVFGVLISSNRKSLATLLALGYSKASIAVSVALTSLVIGAVPAIVGYLIGFGAQYSFMGAFQNFWTIPTYGHAFSIVSLLITAILPLVALFVLLIIVSLLSLKYNIPDMLRDNIHDNSWIVAKIMTPFKGLGIKTKYAFALTLRNSGKLLLVSMTSVIASIALIVGLSTIGTSKIAYDKTVATTNYQYKVDLVTPTVEGGQYSKVYYGQDSTGKYGYYSDLESSQSIPMLPTSSALDTKEPHWHVPSTFDKAYGLPYEPTDQVYKSQWFSSVNTVEKVSHYLKNAVQTKQFIDASVGGINPWDVAKQLMPDNQLNTAIENDKEITKLKNKLGISSFDDFISNSAAASSGVQPYLITYGTTVLNKGDETYTYIDSDLILNGQKANLHITGLNEKTTMYNLDSNLLKSMNDSFFADNNFVPIAINKYSQSNYNLNIGSVIDGVVNNDIDRNYNSHQTHNVKFKVVAIIDSYNESSFITTQKIANDVIQLQNDGFNGVLSKNKDSALLSSLPLYSASGMYFGTDTIRQGDVFEKWLNLALKDNSIWSTEFQKEIASDFSEFKAKYSESPLASMLNRVEWQKMNQLTFNSVSELTTILIDIIEGISIALSVIFTIIVISLIVRTNRKRIATLWTIGYRKKEIVRIFASNMLIPIAVALAIAAPVSVGIMTALKEFVMHFGHILIPFSVAAWVPFVVAGAITIVYIAATSLSVRTLSSASALEAFKED